MNSSARSLALAALLVVAGLAVSLGGIMVGETYRQPLAKLAGGFAMAAALVGAFFVARQGRPAASRGWGAPTLLIVDGVMLAACGLAIGELDDAPGAALIGFVVLLGDFIAAGFCVRRAVLAARVRAGAGGLKLGELPSPALAALFALNGAVAMVAFWMVGLYLDPPGAPGIGAVLLTVNAIAAISALRR